MLFIREPDFFLIPHVSLPSDAILADGTIVSAVDLQDGKGGLSAGYGVSHNLDGTGWLEFDLPQPIDPNAVTYLKVDQTIIPLTAAE